METQKKKCVTKFNFHLLLFSFFCKYVYIYVSSPVYLAVTRHHWLCFWHSNAFFNTQHYKIFHFYLFFTFSWSHYSCGFCCFFFFIVRNKTKNNITSFHRTHTYTHTPPTAGKYTSIFFSCSFSICSREILININNFLCVWL